MNPETRNSGAPDETRKKFRALSKLFHPDSGGDHELMVALNRAYEQAEKGSTALLDNLYNEWTTDEGRKHRELQEQQARIFRTVQQELEQLSLELFERTKKQKVAWYEVVPQLKRKYIELCREHKLIVDQKFFRNFLYEQGWISEEERDKSPWLAW